MARILIDVSIAGEQWLREAMVSLSKCANVTFLYSDSDKYKREVTRHKFLGAFLKLMKDKGKREDTVPAKCVEIIEWLEQKPEWQVEEACDDPHICAIVYQKPSVYVFTRDVRLVKCQQCMTNVLEKRYRDFTTVQSLANYEANEGQIRA